YFVLHEGLIGVFGEEGLVELKYKDVRDDGRTSYSDQTGGWLGITDKYWASALVPQDITYRGEFRQDTIATGESFVAAYLGNAMAVEPGAAITVSTRLFAGAKEVAVVDGYHERLGIDRFDLLIDWGWFYFLTKPLFQAIHFFFNYFGNFGVAILLVTVLIKLLFLPLANASYASMSRMKKVQPQMKALQERYKDDRMEQQKQLMELYKREKINPISGCWPMLIQIPVFFALYKVLFVTIEMRHAPFIGWIHDLSAPDPTNFVNLFGLLPFDAPNLQVGGLHLTFGFWPLLMGITMFIQMKLNPAPTDKTQAAIFNWMPVFFTPLMAGFPAGLVIYWTWNNFLSILQQSFIMRRHGVEIELFNNIRSMFGRGKKPAE
ncbi:MAG: membrane protein insertase YidC, partial [Hyphomicrobiaceae bacterium]|nr:membrane protein insertase YidC [Hyphomicrobiaceae bacterium]